MKRACVALLLIGDDFETTCGVTLVPGDLRATRRRHSVERSGWGGPAPELLRQ